jgi:hypothetical protein
MRDRVVAYDEAESNDRWRDWQSHPDDGERRRTRTLRTVCVVIAIALSVWAFVQFV